MGKEFNLNVETRSKEEKIKQLRRDDYVPGVVYGAGKENVIVKMKKNELEKAFEQAGESNLINLQIDKKTTAKVLIKGIEKDWVTNKINHADFYMVDMDKEIRTEIPLQFTGESEAVEVLGGTLVKSITHVNVECMPGDLVDHINVNLSALKEIGDHIRLSDVKIPSGMKILDPEDETIVMVAEAAKEEEPEQAVEAATETAEGKPEEKKTE